MLYPEYSQSKKAEQNSIVSKYHLDKQKENKFDSVTPQPVSYTHLTLPTKA